MKYLIVSAVRFEAEPSIKILESLGVEIEFFPLGIGPLAAAACGYELNERARNKRVLYIGTCGVFGKFNSTYLVSAREVRWSPIGERCKISYGIEGSSPPLAVSAKPQGLTEPLERKIVLCAPSISLQPELPAGLTGNSEVVENLELYPVLPVLHEVAGSVDIVLGVTNEIGVKAHKQWKDNFRLAADKTADFIKSRFYHIERHGKA